MKHILLKRVATLCIALLLPVMAAMAQESNTPMDAFIAREKQQHSFHPVTRLLQPDLQTSLSSVDAYVTKARLFVLDAAALSDFMKDQYKGIRLSLPDGNGGTFEIDLARFDIYATGFRVEQVANGITSPVAYTPGLCYRGVVNGYPGALAAFSFFNDELYGVFSLPGVGNYSLTPNTLDPDSRKEHYILYNDRDLKIVRHQDACRSDELDAKKILGADRTASRVTFNNCKDVEVFLKADNATYQARSSSTTSVTNYLTSIFNVLSTIYRNEGIYTSIKTISINTTADDYQSLNNNSFEFLNKFGQLTQNNLNGADVAHLVSTRFGGVMGGIAWLDVLCDPYTYYSAQDYHVGPYAFSNIYANETAGSFPTYTWNVECMTHEMGHNLGSPHTHNCTAWSGGPIDGCAPTYNAAYAEGTCATGPIPSAAVQGTIMSYCHLLSGVGISFANGFGPQPGDLIRSRIGSGSCATNYIPDTVLTVTGTSLAATRECTDASGLTFYWNDNNSVDEADDRLVLKLKKGTNSIGTLDSVGFAVSTTTLAAYGSNTGTPITFPAGTLNIGSPNAAMNRYWNVTPTAQPLTPVEVQFPFAQQDVNDIAGSIPSATSYTQLKFYKMATGVNPNPAAGFAGATAANTVIYTYNAATAGLNTWTSYTSGNTRFARFLVSSFSGGAGFGSTVVPLPMELIWFRGALKGNVVSLDWEVAREQEIKEYQVERSADGLHYELMSIVASQNQASKIYNAIDSKPLQGGNYYRLSTVSADGIKKIAAYTQVLISQASAVSIYPNPVKDVLHIDLTGKLNGKTSFRMTDMQGRVVRAADLQQQVNTFDLRQLARGMYLIELAGNNELIREKILLQ